MTPYAPRAVRVVADTNIVVSGLLWEGGPPRRLIDAAFAGEIELYTSAVLLDELADVLTRAKFARKLSASALSAEQLVWRYARLAKRIRPDTVERVVPGDPDDDHVLACAFAANVELINLRRPPPACTRQLPGDPHRESRDRHHPHRTTPVTFKARRRTC